MTEPAVARAIDDIAAGRLVIVVDDADREDEGDLVMAAAAVTPTAVNFMASAGRGLICVALPGERLAALDLPLMVSEDDNTALLGTAFTVSVDAARGTTTGISAYDRSRTVEVLMDPQARPADLARPGHVFPLRAHDDGVLGRRGQTEAGVDLSRLAGLPPGAVVCEIMADDGHMARGPALAAFARQHSLAIISVEALAAHRRARGRNVPAQRREKL